MNTINSQTSGSAAADETTVTDLVGKKRLEPFRIPLFAALVTVVFGLTSVVGAIVGYMTISQAKSTAIAIAGDMQD
ncbi:hypothetical protein HK405_009095, partial [Cladochytrium tenue]